MTLTEDQELAAEGWIKHDGTEMPVPSDTVVNVLLRGFANKESRKAGEWVWYDCGDSTITHYRIVSPNTDRAQVEALGKVADVPDAMTLRDQFAMATVPAVYQQLRSEQFARLSEGASRSGIAAHDCAEVSAIAYRIADAMLAERAKK